MKVSWGLKTSNDFPGCRVSKPQGWGINISLIFSLEPHCALLHVQIIWAASSLRVAHYRLVFQGCKDNNIHLEFLCLSEWLEEGSSFSKMSSKSNEHIAPGTIIMCMTDLSSSTSLNLWDRDWCPIFQVRKFQYREFKWLTHDHTVTQVIIQGCW